MRRIRAAGGFVEFNRVNGTLALSRALGDFEFKCATRLPKDQMVTGGSGFYFFLNISVSFSWHGVIPQKLVINEIICLSSHEFCFPLKKIYKKCFSNAKVYTGSFNYCDLSRVKIVT